MAVTKTHPIKSTLKAAINYICNPAKTDGSLLISSYGCSAETVDIEVEILPYHPVGENHCPAFQSIFCHHPLRRFHIPAFYGIKIFPVKPLSGRF